MKGQLLANPTACTRTESRSQRQQPIENRALTGLSERVIGTRSRNVNSSISAAKEKARPLNNRMPLGDTSFDAGITSGYAFTATKSSCVVNGSSSIGLTRQRSNSADAADPIKILFHAECRNRYGCSRCDIHIEDAVLTLLHLCCRDGE